LALVECRRQGAQVDDLVLRVVERFRTVEALDDAIDDVVNKGIVTARGAVAVHGDRLVREELTGELALQEHFLTAFGAQPGDYFLTAFGAQPGDYFLTAFGAWIAKSGRTLKALPLPTAVGIRALAGASV